MGNLEDQSSLLLILPLPIYWHEGEYFCDDQACNGLALWLKNFDTVTLCCPMIAVDVVPGNNLPLTELCRGGRLSVVPMPSAWTFIEFFWAIVPTITKIRRLIETHRYLQFAIGGLWGDWGAVSILVLCAPPWAASISPPGSSVAPMKRPNIHVSNRPTSSMTVKNEGTKTSDRTVDTSKPPMTAMAMGARNSPPSPSA